MKTKPWAMGMVLFCTLLTSTAQLFYKFGAETLEFNFLSIITNINLLAGILLYAVGGTILILSFRGGEVSVLYPIFATSYIWVTILSNIIFNEQINIHKTIGVALIIFGIIAIGFGSRKEQAHAPEVI